MTSTRVARLVAWPGIGGVPYQIGGLLGHGSIKFHKPPVSTVLFWSEAFFAAFTVNSTVNSVDQSSNSNLHSEAWCCSITIQFELTCHRIASCISVIEASLKVMGLTNMFSSTNASFLVAVSKTHLIVSFISLSSGVGPEVTKADIFDVYICFVSGSIYVDALHSRAG